MRERVEGKLGMREVAKLDGSHDGDEAVATRKPLVEGSIQSPEKLGPLWGRKHVAALRNKHHAGIMSIWHVLTKSLTGE